MGTGSLHGILSSALHRSDGKQIEYLCAFKLTCWLKITNKNRNLLTDFLELEFKMISFCLGLGDHLRGNFGLVKHIRIYHIVVSFFICHVSGRYFFFGGVTLWARNEIAFTRPTCQVTLDRQGCGREWPFFWKSSWCEQLRRFLSVRPSILGWPNSS